MATGDPCDVCGSPIPNGHGPRKRCSPACRREASRRYQRAFYRQDPARALAYQHTFQVRNIDEYRQSIKDRPAETYLGRRAHMLKTHYDLTLDQYDAMALAQGGRCAICRRVETRLNRGRPLPLSVDHDHDTGVVRGLLCGRCNSILGFLEETELFNAATDYLRRHRPVKEVRS